MVATQHGKRDDPARGHSDVQTAAKEMNATSPKVAELLYLMSLAYLANMTGPFARFWNGWNPANQ